MTSIWIARIIAVLVFIFCVWFFFLKDLSCGGSDYSSTSGTTIYKYDTTVIERVVTKADTVIKWHEKIVYKKSEPVIVNFQKVDTVFINKAKKLDLVMKLEKKADQITAYTINMNDTLLKESIYVGIGRDFEIISQHGKLFVKSKRFYFSPFIFGYEHKRKVNDIKNKFTHNVQLLTGFNYMEKFHFNAGLVYDLSKSEGSILDKTDLKAEFIYKPFY